MPSKERLSMLARKRRSQLKSQARKMIAEDKKSLKFGLQDASGIKRLKTDIDQSQKFLKRRKRDK